MNDLISREDAIKEAYTITVDGESFDVVQVETLEGLPPAEPEPSIPLSWFDEQIERLKDLDNAFATLTALQISGMVKKWSDEQNE